jgi:hypothetical protein
MAENKANISLDDFVSKVVKDPKQPPDTTLLTGYLGKSSEEGHTRIYFDPELKNYLEVPNDAVLHTQEIPKEVSSLGGSHIWIKSDAELIHGKVGPSRTKAKFFEGPIAAAAAAAAIGGGGQVGGPQGGAGNSIIPCVVTGASVCACPSPQPLCFTPLCFPTTPERGCIPTIQFTQCHGCPPPTHFTQCPTILHGCPTPPAFCPPHTIPALCFPHLTPGCPLATAPACPSVGGCPSIQCGFPGGGAVDPGIQQFAAHGITIPACPSALVPCPHTPLPGCPIPTQITQCPTPLHGCPPPTQVTQCPTPLHGCPLPTPLHGCPPLTPLHGCPPLTPLHGCPPPTQVTHCPTPLHGCPPPPTPLCQSVHVPCLTPNQLVCHPTNPVICHPLTPLCPTLHCQSVPVCPSAGACPSIACGGNPGGGGINQ